MSQISAQNVSALAKKCICQYYTQWSARRKNSLLYHVEKSKIRLSIESNQIKGLSANLTEILAQGENFWPRVL